VVAAGIVVINAAPHHRDIAATVIYLTLLLMAANVVSIRVVIGVSLICMATIVAMFFVDEGYQDWDSLDQASCGASPPSPPSAFSPPAANQAADKLHQHRNLPDRSSAAEPHRQRRTSARSLQLMSWSGGERKRIFEYPLDMPVTKGDDPGAHTWHRIMALIHGRVRTSGAPGAADRNQTSLADAGRAHQARIHMIATPLYRPTTTASNTSAR
jgi:two-component system sensor kinase FixL